MKKRTRQHKIATQARREQHSAVHYHYTSDEKGVSRQPRPTPASVFGYDTAFIFGDLRKTLVITLVVLVVLLGITWYLK